MFLEVNKLNKKLFEILGRVNLQDPKIKSGKREAKDLESKQRFAGQHRRVKATSLWPKNAFVFFT